ncbi:hypothetical protein D3C85_1332160 [compost metagenome]
MIIRYNEIASRLLRLTGKFRSSSGSSSPSRISGLGQSTAPAIVLVCITREAKLKPAHSLIELVIHKLLGKTAFIFSKSRCAVNASTAKPDRLIENGVSIKKNFNPGCQE